MSKTRQTSWKKLTRDERGDLCQSVSWQHLLTSLGIRFRVRKNGRVYAWSPFKQEQTPSMLCTERDMYGGHFHCFSTGEFGDKVWLASKLCGRPMSDPVVLRYFNYGQTTIVEDPNQGKFNFGSQQDPDDLDDIPF